MQFGASSTITTPVAITALGYQNPRVIQRLMSEHQLTETEATALFVDTLRFLTICGENPDGRWGPTPQIDLGWHAFLMHTREYEAFCRDHFGTFIHHNPNEPDAPKDVQRPRRTLRLAMERFGELSDNWTYPNEQGDPVLSPANIDVTDVNMASACDSCGCSPCD